MAWVFCFHVYDSCRSIDSGDDGTSKTIQQLFKFSVKTRLLLETACGVTPTPSGVTPHACRVTPTPSGVTPHACRVTPTPSGVTPHACRVTPHASGVTPHACR